MTDKNYMERLLNASNGADKTVRNVQRSLGSLESKHLNIIKLGTQLYRDWDKYFSDFDSRSQHMVKLVELLMRRWEKIGSVSSDGGDNRLSQGSSSGINAHNPTSYSYDGGFGRSDNQVSALLARVVTNGLRHL